ncbi:MAG: triose-phosphate isomerase [Geminicoccaceae bacterium]
MTFRVGTGWKMNKTRAQAADYVRTLLAAPDLATIGAQLFVLPPFTALAEVAQALAASPVEVGAQNMHWAADGAWTGEISAAIDRRLRSSHSRTGALGAAYAFQ